MHALKSETRRKRNEIKTKQKQEHNNNNRQKQQAGEKKIIIKFTGYVNESIFFFSCIYCWHCWWQFACMPYFQFQKSHTTHVPVISAVINQSIIKQPLFQCFHCAVRMVIGSWPRIACMRLPILCTCLFLLLLILFIHMSPLSSTIVWSFFHLFLRSPLFLRLHRFFFVFIFFFGYCCFAFSYI